MKSRTKIIEFEHNGLSVKMRKGFNCWRAMIDGKAPAFVIGGRNAASARIKVTSMIENGDYKRFQFAVLQK